MSGAFITGAELFRRSHADTRLSALRVICVSGPQPGRPSLGGGGNDFQGNVGDPREEFWSMFNTFGPHRGRERQ